jgi:hypothetical protein
MVFLIDLPRLHLPKPDQTLFAKELHHFCSAKGIPGDILDLLHEYDFAKTKHMAFVHSIGGSNGGDDWKRTGYCGLGAAVKSLGYASGPGLQVDYVVRITSTHWEAYADYTRLHLWALQTRTSSPTCTGRRWVTTGYGNYSAG